MLRKPREINGWGGSKGKTSIKGDSAYEGGFPSLAFVGLYHASLHLQLVEVASRSKSLGERGRLNIFISQPRHDGVRIQTTPRSGDFTRRSCSSLNPTLQLLQVQQKRRAGTCERRAYTRKPEHDLGSEQHPFKSSGPPTNRHKSGAARAPL